MAGCCRGSLHGWKGCAGFCGGLFPWGRWRVRSSSQTGGVPPSSSPAALLKEAIHVISCGYEDKTDWGLEDILTGFKMHCRGWRSVFISLFISIFATGILELQWSGVSIEEWWRNEQFWVIDGVSAHLFAVVQGLLKVFTGIDTNFTVTSKATGDEDDGYVELYAFKWTTLLIPPTTLLIINNALDRLESRGEGLGEPKRTVAGAVWLFFIVIYLCQNRKWAGNVKRANDQLKIERWGK